MRILVFSDIHNDVKALGRLLDIEADYYFAAGDMLTWAKGAAKIGEALARRREHMYVLPGNHESVRDIEELCAQYGLQTFHGQTLQLGNYTVAGLGYSCPTPFNTPGEYSEREMAERLAPFAALENLILICHCPPKATPLDRAGDGLHFGSTAIRQFIEQHQPLYFFCGHIHEAEGVKVELGVTTGVNVGKRGFLLELD